MILWYRFAEYLYSDFPVNRRVYIYSRVKFIFNLVVHFCTRILLQRKNKKIIVLLSVEHFIPSSWGKQGETPVIGLLELSVGEGKSIKRCIASGVLSWGKANDVPIVIQEVHPGERERINLQQSSWRFLPSLSGVIPSLIIQREEVRCWEW